jgi:hypothetical protein
MGSINKTSRYLVLLAGTAIALTACSSGSTSAESANPPAATGPAAPAPAVNSGSAKEFCLAALQLGKDALPTAGDANPSASLQQVGGAWARLAKIAPAEIKPDVKQIADAIGKITADTPEADAAAAMGSLSVPIQHYTQWGAAHCQGVTG